jgi:hypothetical protein
MERRMIMVTMSRGVSVRLVDPDPIDKLVELVLTRDVAGQLRIAILNSARAEALTEVLAAIATELSRLGI